MSDSTLHGAIAAWGIGALTLMTIGIVAFVMLVAVSAPRNTGVFFVTMLCVTIVPYAVGKLLLFGIELTKD